MTSENCPTKAWHFDGLVLCEYTGVPKGGPRPGWSKWWVGFEWYHCWHELGDSDGDRCPLVVGWHQDIAIVERWVFVDLSSFLECPWSISFLLGDTGWLENFATSQTLVLSCNHRRRDCQSNWFCWSCPKNFEGFWRLHWFGSLLHYLVVWFCCMKRREISNVQCIQNGNSSRTVGCWLGRDLSKLAQHLNRIFCCWCSYKRKENCGLVKFHRNIWLYSQRNLFIQNLPNLVLFQM